MHAAMHHRRRNFWGGEQDFGHKVQPWSRADLEDLQYYLDYGNTLADAASMLCRDEAEVRQKPNELGLMEHRTIASVRCRI